MTTALTRLASHPLFRIGSVGLLARTIINVATRLHDGADAHEDRRGQVRQPRRERHQERDEGKDRHTAAPPAVVDDGPASLLVVTLTPDPGQRGLNECHGFRGLSLLGGLVGPSRQDVGAQWPVISSVCSRLVGTFGSSRRASWCAAMDCSLSPQ